jgi:hypothetical protein
MVDCMVGKKDFGLAAKKVSKMVVFGDEVV